MIVTRFAPSPTGSIHIGGLRTALYAYAFARQQEGIFILRIEDTDQKREIAGAAEKLETILHSFGLDWDQKFVQSERARDGIYAEYAKKLVTEGHAFYCQCEGRNAKTEGYSTILRDPCRDLGYTNGAIKLRIPDDETVTYFDFVFQKDITWNTNDVRDATLLKSDGVFPTYHLALAVDDHEMGVTHIFRGHDWLPSTPIHLLVFKYLGFDLPALGHLTDILDPEGGKLSKRKGSTSCEGLLAEGYLPEAIVNFVALCGWAPKDNTEMYTLENFIKAFSLNGIQKANPIFNREKLDWFNREYIKMLNFEQKLDAVRPYLVNLEGFNEKIFVNFAHLIVERVSKWSDIDELIENGDIQFFFVNPEIDMSQLPGKKGTPEIAHSNLERIKSALLEYSGEMSPEAIKDYLMPIAEELGRAESLWPLRFALSGKEKSPDPFTLISILGVKTSVERITAVLTK